MTPQETLAAHRDEFVGFVARRLGNRELAEDLVHSVLAHAVPRVEAVRDEPALLAWFYRSLRNALVDRTRRAATEAKALDALARELEEFADAADLTAPRVCRCVLRLAQGLKPEYADALLRIEVDGAAVKDFGVERGISSSNAAVRVFRAREALRRGVVATCGACAASGCRDCGCD
jgi:RNA polymerase sigma-70 factor (ECF subfamily)